MRTWTPRHSSTRARRSRARPPLRPLAIAAVVAAALALVAADGVVAQTPPVTVTVSPVQMTLAPGERGTGALLVENQSSAAVVLGRITATAASTSVRIKVARLRARRLAPGASSVIAYNATRLREGYGHDVGLSFVVDYKSGPTAGAAIAAATMIANPPLPLIGLALDGNVSSISQYRPGDVAIVVTNLRSDPVTLEHLMVTGTQSVETSVITDSASAVPVAAGATVDVLRGTPVVLGPREIRTFPAQLSIGDQVDPGSRMLLVTAAAVPGASSTASSAMTAGRFEAVATQPFTVAVYGESDILTGVGAPGFLVLPGIVLAVVTLFLIAKLSPWRSVIKLGSGPAGTLGTATATAIFGVAASLVVAKIYPWLTQHLVPGVRRDYLQAYGFVDFYYVLAYAFAISIAFWALSWPAYAVARGMLWLPFDGDSVEALFRQLGFWLAQRKNTPCAIRETTEAHSHLGVVLRQHGGQVWLSPVIRITVLKDPGDLAMRLEDALAHKRLSEVYRMVRDAEVRRQVQFTFAPGMLSEPQTVKEAAAAPNGQARKIIELAPPEQ
jgi:hypothetical protein